MLAAAEARRDLALERYQAAVARAAKRHPRPPVRWSNWEHASRVQARRAEETKLEKAELDAARREVRRILCGRA